MTLTTRAIIAAAVAVATLLASPAIAGASGRTLAQNVDDLDCDLAADAGTNGCTLSDLNCFTAYPVEILQDPSDSPPLLNFQFGEANLVDPFQCAGDCIGMIASADPLDAFFGATLEAAEFLPASFSCSCTYVISANGQRIVASDKTTTIVTLC